VQHITAACAKHPALQVHILLDHSRGTRGHRHHASSLTTLAPLLSHSQNTSTNVRVSLFRMPQLSGPFARRFLPSPVNEAVAVSHVKVMAFDDEEVLITGANLSEDYFTTRQDRYVHIRGGGGGGREGGRGGGPLAWGGGGGREGGRPESLAGFYHELIEVLGRYAVSPLVALSQEPGSIVDFHALKIELLQLFSSTPSSLPPSSSDDKNACWAMPTIQCGPLGIRHDQALLHALLSSLPPSLPSSPSQHLTLATAYLNPPLSFLRDLATWQQGGREGGREEGRRLSILGPSAETHGFAGARGVKAFIPLAYALHEQRVRKHFHPSLPPSLPPFLYRYTRPGWTFHGKGLWLLEEEEGGEGGREGGKEGDGGRVALKKGGKEGGREGGGVALTVAGSSNYGHRSFERDLESQVWLVSGEGGREGGLKERMREEKAALLRDCTLVVGEGEGGREDGTEGEEEVLLRGHRKVWAPMLTTWTQGLL